MSENGDTGPPAPPPAPAGDGDARPRGPSGGGLAQMTIPIWDGRAETIDTYAGQVELLVLGTPVENRPLLGPRLVAVLPEGSTQQRLALRLPRDVGGQGSITADDGPQNI
eukprot:13572348-Alexandrium_andersonii.AAC.1